MNNRCLSSMLILTAYLGLSCGRLPSEDQPPINKKTSVSLIATSKKLPDEQLENPLYIKRFVQAHDRLYITSIKNLSIFDITIADDMVLKNVIQLGTDFKSIEIVADKLELTSIDSKLFTFNLDDPDHPKDLARN